MATSTGRGRVEGKPKGVRQDTHVVQAVSEHSAANENRHDDLPQIVAGKNICAIFQQHKRSENPLAKPREFS